MYSVDNVSFKNNFSPLPEDTTGGIKRSLLSIIEPIINPSDALVNVDVRAIIFSQVDGKHLIKLSCVSKFYQSIAKAELISRINFGKITFEHLKASSQSLEISKIIDFLGKDTLQITRLDLREGFSKIDDNDIRLISENFKNTTQLALVDKTGLSNASREYLKNLTAIKELIFENSVLEEDDDIDELFALDDFSCIENYPSLVSLKLIEYKPNFNFLKERTNLTSLHIESGDKEGVSFLTTKKMCLKQCCSSLKNLFLGHFINKNLNFLEGCSSLESFDIQRFDELENIDAIAHCTSLKKLGLIYCTLLNNLNVLKHNKFPHLEEIDLSDSDQVNDLSFLINCGANLKKLSLYVSDYREIKDTRPLLHCKELITLDLQACGIDDTSDLIECTKLESLNLGWNDINDISSLSNFKSLKELNLWSTHVSDLTPLSFCTELEELNLANCPVVDISALQYCNLKKITLSSGFEIENTFLIRNFINPNMEIEFAGLSRAEVPLTINHVRDRSKS